MAGGIAIVGDIDHNEIIAVEHLSIILISIAAEARGPFFCTSDVTVGGPYDFRMRRQTTVRTLLPATTNVADRDRLVCARRVFAR